jgi:hypothetical protein
VNPQLLHWLQGLLYTLLSVLIVASANYLRVNPVPGYDLGLQAVLVGVLLALDKYVRDSLGTTAARSV